jgi:hypothetical protein
VRLSRNSDTQPPHKRFRGGQGGLSHSGGGGSQHEEAISRPSRNSERDGERGRAAGEGSARSTGRYEESDANRDRPDTTREQRGDSGRDRSGSEGRGGGCRALGSGESRDCGRGESRGCSGKHTHTHTDTDTDTHALEVKTRGGEAGQREKKRSRGGEELACRFKLPFEPSPALLRIQRQKERENERENDRAKEREREEREREKREKEREREREREMPVPARTKFHTPPGEILPKLLIESVIDLTRSPTPPPVCTSRSSKSPLSQQRRGSAVKWSNCKQDASMEVIEVSDHSGGGPYVGARVQVLFDVDGMQEWYGGLIASEKEETGKWLVLFDDGDEETIVWPDPKGEVRILGAKSLSAKQNRTDKEGNEGSKRPRDRPGKQMSTTPIEHLEASIEVADRSGEANRTHPPLPDVERDGSDKERHIERSREQHRPAERARASEEIGRGSTWRLLHVSSSPSACDLKTYTKELASCKSFDALSPTTSPRVVQVHAGVSLSLSRSLARSLSHSLTHFLFLSPPPLSLSLLDFHPTFNWVLIIPKAL